MQLGKYYLRVYEDMHIFAYLYTVLFINSTAHRLSKYKAVEKRKIFGYLSIFLGFSFLLSVLHY